MGCDATGICRLCLASSSAVANATLPTGVLCSGCGMWWRAQGEIDFCAAGNATFEIRTSHPIGAEISHLTRGCAWGWTRVTGGCMGLGSWVWGWALCTAAHRTRLGFLTVRMPDSRSQKQKPNPKSRPCFWASGTQITRSPEPRSQNSKRLRSTSIAQSRSSFPNVDPTSRRPCRSLS